MYTESERQAIEAKEKAAQDRAAKGAKSRKRDSQRPEDREKRKEDREARKQEEREQLQPRKKDFELRGEAEPATPSPTLAQPSIPPPSIASADAIPAGLLPQNRGEPQGAYASLPDEGDMRQRRLDAIAEEEGDLFSAWDGVLVPRLNQK